MSYRAEVIADSVSPEGQRISTLEVVMPRVLLAEMNTHRVFSRNSASSRAIPTHKQIRSVIENPYIPSVWSIDEPGMQGAEVLTDPDDIKNAVESWLYGREHSVLAAVALMGGIRQLAYGANGEKFTGQALEDAEQLQETVAELKSRLAPDILDLGHRMHKQNPNRLLEPWLWHTIVITSTEWNNFYGLRTDANAEPHIQIVAGKMLAAHRTSTPDRVGYGEYHLPYVTLEDKEKYPTEQLIKMAVARCARTSSEKQRDQKTIDGEVSMYERLTSNGHASPLEHPARPMTALELKESKFNGNFRGWWQHRSDVPGSDNFQAQQGLEEFVQEHFYAA
jgi:thymidylate synthase ThyX